MTAERAARLFLIYGIGSCRTYDGTASDNAFLDAQKQRLVRSIDNGLGANHAIMSSKTVPATPTNYGFEETIHQHIVVTSGGSLKEEVTGTQLADSAEDLHKGKLWYLHHELGHSLTVETLQGGETVQEAMADSYATMRHIERFGAESDFPQAMADARMVEAIHKGQADHLTTPAACYFGDGQNASGGRI